MLSFWATAHDATSVNSMTVLHADHGAGHQGRQLLQASPPPASTSSLSQQIFDAIRAGNSTLAGQLIAQSLNTGDQQAVTQALSQSTASVSPDN